MHLSGCIPTLLSQTLVVLFNDIYEGLLYGYLQQIEAMTNNLQITAIQ